MLVTPCVRAGSPRDPGPEARSRTRGAPEPEGLAEGEWLGRTRDPSFEVSDFEIAEAGCMPHVERSEKLNTMSPMLLMLS